MNKYIQTTLKDLLSSLDKLFETGELAYLSAQCKNELQIRDKIAWRLHKLITDKYGKQFVVRREWAPEGFGKQRVDLAVLELDSSMTKVVRVVALVEFKAQSIVRREKWYIDSFIHDVQKMRELVKHCPVCNDADLYFVFLETGQERKADTYKQVLGYAIYQTGSVKYRSDADYLPTIQEHWNEFPQALGEQIAIHEPEAIDIGEAFGYKQYVSPLLIGPFK